MGAGWEQSTLWGDGRWRKWVKLTWRLRGVGFMGSLQ